MRSSRWHIQLLLATVTIWELAAGPALAQTKEPYDPWEGFNRKMYAINTVLDRNFLSPLAHGFGRLPTVIRRPLSNFSRNLTEPLVFVNDVLQVRPAPAAKTLGRFVMNTTVGVGGLLDPASHNHLPHHDNSFGTTLGRWGAGPGPFIFVPLAGPSDLRDGVGAISDLFMNPIFYTRFDYKPAVTVTTALVNGLNARLDADQALSTIRETSTDPYATLRSFYLQNRAAVIRGQTGAPEALPDFDMPDIPSDAGAAGAAPPADAASPAQPSPATPRPETSPEAPASAPPASGPKWLVQPDTDGPLRTAGADRFR